MMCAASACLTAWPMSRMLDALGEHCLDGLLLPLAEQLLEPSVFPHRLNEPLGFVPGQLTVDESALFEATPFIVGAVARGGIVGTAATRFAAYARPMLERARTDIVQPREGLSNLGNPL